MSLGCRCDVLAMSMRCRCDVLAMSMRCPCDEDAMSMRMRCRCRCDVLAMWCNVLVMSMRCSLSMRCTCDVDAMFIVDAMSMRCPCSARNSDRKLFGIVFASRDCCLDLWTGFERTSSSRIHKHPLKLNGGLKLTEPLNLPVKKIRYS